MRKHFEMYPKRAVSLTFLPRLGLGTFESRKCMPVFVRLSPSVCLCLSWSVCLSLSVGLWQSVSLLAGGGSTPWAFFCSSWLWIYGRAKVSRGRRASAMQRNHKTRRTVFIFNHEYISRQRRLRYRCTAKTWLRVLPCSPADSCAGDARSSRCRFLLSRF